MKTHCIENTLKLIRHKAWIIAFYAVIALFASCSSVINTPSVRNTLSVNYCKPTIEYDYSALSAQTPLTARQDSVLGANLSKHDRLMSRTIGIDGFLAEYLLSKTDTLKGLVLKQKILGRMMLASIEIDAMSGELECYAERMEQLANYIGGINDKNIRWITIASVAVDAVTSAAAIFTDNAYLAAGGGLASIGLGALTISPKGKKVALPIERNLLGDIWYNENNHNAFPHSIWTALNDPDFSNTSNRSMRENICQRWLQFVFDNEIDPKTENLFFGSGGLYTADDLHTRVHMTKEVQAIIQTIQQDVKALSIKINSLD